MRSRIALLLAVLPLFLFNVARAAANPATPAAEYSTHFDALTKLSIAVAQAMPADQYSFKPHPESMNFGELMSHIAVTNYQFCAGIKDTNPPDLPSPTDKDGVVKFLSDSFSYCSGVISTLTEDQLSNATTHPTGIFLAVMFCWQCTFTWPIIVVRQRFICATRALSRLRTEFENRRGGVDIVGIVLKSAVESSSDSRIELRPG
jgi:hypothetical protein